MKQEIAILAIILLVISLLPIYPLPATDIKGNFWIWLGQTLFPNVTPST